MSKANSKSLIHIISSRKGLKSYGKIQDPPDINPGDKGFSTPINPRFKSTWPGKDYLFYPAKWGYTWNVALTKEDIEFLSK